MAKEILCGFGIDVDAVAGWLGSYGGEDSPDDISRGLFAGEVGAPRLLKLFERLGIKTTWFIPGHSIETFPKEMQAVADAGHEIGIHGYSPRAGNRGAGQVHRPRHETFGQTADRICGAVVGVFQGLQ
jgi:peptidoglycan/xylan/chitin deacetylase (PgdA/CDA1 family)